MDGFCRVVASFAVLVVANVALADQAGRFIPQSPLDETEKATERARLKKTPAFSDQFIEQLLADEEHYHSYREADIFAAYPELRGEKKLSLCSNSIIGGATEITFLAGRVKNNEVELDKVGCRRVKAGLSCGEPKRDHFYFLDSAERYFSLDGLSFETARTILETLHARGVSGLPQWLHAQVTSISSIKSQPGDRYEMIFGDTLCAGCIEKFDVRLESTHGDSQLVFAGDPRSVCF
jgi:hypothetical protein